MKGMLAGIPKCRKGERTRRRPCTAMAATPVPAHHNPCNRSDQPQGKPQPMQSFRSTTGEATTHAIVQINHRGSHKGIGTEKLGIFCNPSTFWLKSSCIFKFELGLILCLAFVDAAVLALAVEYLLHQRQGKQVKGAVLSMSLTRSSVCSSEGSSRILQVMGLCGRPVATNPRTHTRIFSNTLNNILPEV